MERSGGPRQPAPQGPGGAQGPRGVGKGGNGKGGGPGVPGRGPSSGPGQGPGQGMNRPRGSIRAILLRLVRYMRPHALILTCVVCAAVLTTAAELAPPVIIRQAVDQLARDDASRTIWRAAGALLALALVQGAIDFFRLYLTAVMGQRIIFEIRSAVFEHLSRLSFSFYDRARSGDLMSRVTADVEALNNFFGRAAVIMVTNVLTVIGVFVVLMTWDWRLALVYLACIPLVVHGMSVYATRVRPAMGQARRALSGLSSALQESLAGFLVVKLFGREAFEEKRVGRQSQRVLTANLETARITSLWMPYAHVIMGVATALVLWIGGWRVISGAVTLGTLIGFTTYIQVLLRPIRQTGMMLSSTLQALAAAERVFELLDTRPEVQDAPGAVPLPPVQGTVRFENVTFAYAGDTSAPQDPALSGVTLEARPGEMVALVGPSGAGKSTLVHLLPRFYDAQSGRITIDGHDIRQVTVKSLRDAIGIALQSVFLFDASIGENIAYGNPHATHKEIEDAARAAQMHEFITSLPLGYGTPVGERGVRLSGGQKQRIALARVLLTDPRILILDEPTSSVDVATERLMQQALDVARAGRTTFVIAHRLWTIQHADQILVLRDGHIVEQARGSATQSAHEALLEQGGLYQELYALQVAGETLMPEAEVPEDPGPQPFAAPPTIPVVRQTTAEGEL